jgi:hypothetical protein
MSGRPSYQRVCFYLKLKDESLNPDDNTIRDPVIVEHADLKQYDELIFIDEQEDSDA